MAPYSSGKCKCGAVSLAIDMKPALTYNCHCSHCQKFANKHLEKPVPYSGGAAMFKWTDENGNVQYGEHPPAGTDAKHIKAAPAPDSASKPDTPSLQERVDALDKRLATEAEQKAEAEQKKQDAENRRINCENVVGVCSLGLEKTYHTVLPVRVLQRE